MSSAALHGRPSSAGTQAFRERLQAFRSQHVPKHLAIGGVTWTYYAAGRGNQCLMVLPGAVGGGELFFLLIQELESRYRILAPDIPALTKIEDFLQGLVTIMDAEDVSRASVLGASFSGLLSQALVRRNPDRVANLLLSHTAVPVPEQAKTNRRAVKVVHYLPTTVVRTLLRIIVWLLLTKVREERKFWRLYFGEILGSLTGEFLIGRYQASIDLCENYRWTPNDLTDWSGKVLIIESDDDRVAHQRLRSALKALYPNAQVHTFHGTGHGSYVANPIQYAAVVRDFLG